MAEQAPEAGTPELLAQCEANGVELAELRTKMAEVQARQLDVFLKLYDAGVSIRHMSTIAGVSDVAIGNAIKRAIAKANPQPKV